MIDNKTMALREMCEEVLVRVPGTLACVVMGSDGVVVESVETQECTLDIAPVLVEYSSACMGLRDVESESHRLGGVRECVFGTEHFATLLRWINNDFLVAVVLKSEGYVGQARFLVSVQEPFFLKELS